MSEKDGRDNIGMRYKAVMAVLALFVLPYFLLITYFGYFGKDVVFLRGGGPAWMLNPEDQPVVNGFPNDLPSIFSIAFNLDSQPREGVIKVSAVKAHSLNVNGAVLSTVEGTAGKNWKRYAVYDITPYIRRGPNTVSVYVRSPFSKTALKVEGYAVTIDGSKVSLDSGDSGDSGGAGGAGGAGWSASSAMSIPDMGVTGMPQRPEFVTHPSFMGKLRRGEYLPGGLLMFGCAFLVMALICLLPRASRAIDHLASDMLPRAFFEEGTKNVVYGLAALLILSVLAATLYHNFPLYPPERTGDFAAHKEYLEYFTKSWRPPLASDGFQMYNPPLFYFVSALLFRVFGSGVFPDVVRYAQAVNSAAAFLSALMVFFILMRLELGRAAVVLTLCVAAFLPIGLYKAPSVSGESSAALLCTALFYFYLRYTESRSRRFALLAGLFTGLALLTRYTALFPLMGITSGFLYMAYRDRAAWKARLTDLCLYAGAAGAVSGWYYVRNLVVFHRLFPICGTPELFFYRQYPGYRDWDFYTNVSALFVNNPLGKDNILDSFFAGSYSTFWYDGQRLFATTQSVALVLLLLALASLPTLMLAWGTVRAAGAVIADGAGSRPAFYASCIITLALSILAYTLGTLNYPYYSMVKSFYILFCVAPIACLLGVGLKAWAERTGWVVTGVWLSAVVAVVLRIFYQ